MGLHPGKLEAIAGGWLPSVKDLGGWRELRCLTTTAGGMAVNCYLVWDEVSREAALFDTGWEAAPVAELAEVRARMRCFESCATITKSPATLAASTGPEPQECKSSDQRKS